ncbi:MAG: helix-turn-helix domain-containing protein [Oscillospiraceae bacterium]
MYRVILAIENEELSAEISALHIWGEHTEFEISAVRNSGDSAYNELKNNHYDLLIVEAGLLNGNGLFLFKRIKAEGLCTRLAVCGKEGDFDLARRAIILGVYDYFVEPFEAYKFVAVFNRIKNETHGNMASKIYHVEELTELFSNRDPAVKDYISGLSGRENITAIVNGTVEVIFERYEWLDLFLSKDDFLADESCANAQKLAELFDTFFALYPQHNSKIHDVIEFILYNPESDLRLKTLSDELYINGSYLSTVFIAQTGLHFVDYIMTVKMYRAAWLLKNTGMKIFEIAERLDYKDIGYFSKQFKKIFSLTPSEFRIPSGYQFVI